MICIFFTLLKYFQFKLVCNNTKIQIVNRDLGTKKLNEVIRIVEVSCIQINILLGNPIHLALVQLHRYRKYLRKIKSFSIQF